MRENFNEREPRENKASVQPEPLQVQLFVFGIFPQSQHPLSSHREKLSIRFVSYKESALQTRRLQLISEIR